MSPSRVAGWRCSRKAGWKELKFGERLDQLRPVASGERAYWGASHGLLIDDFYRHVRAAKHFWIDAPAALESLRVIQTVYDQCPGLSRRATSPPTPGHDQC